jgi:hypothetical protein
VVALSVYSDIERTPVANAFVKALDQCFGTDASRIKRAEHIFSVPGEVTALLADAGFEHVSVDVVTKRITFPSVLDYVRFQLTATLWPVFWVTGIQPTGMRSLGQSHRSLSHFSHLKCCETPS